MVKVNKYLAFQLTQEKPDSELLYKIAQLCGCYHVHTLEQMEEAFKYFVAFHTVETIKKDSHDN